MEKGQTQLLFPYNPDKFWGQMRTIIKEEMTIKAEVKQPEGAREQFLPRTEVAKMLRVSLVTLNSWVTTGRPSHKQQDKVFFTI
jgi:hypothetical protein